MNKILELLQQLHQTCEEFFEAPSAEGDRDIRTLCIRLLVHSPAHLSEIISQNVTSIINSLDEYNVNEILTIIAQLQNQVK